MRNYYDSTGNDLYCTQEDYSQESSGPEILYGAQPEPHSALWGDTSESDSSSTSSDTSGYSQVTAGTAQLLLELYETAVLEYHDSDPSLEDFRLLRWSQRMLQVYMADNTDSTEIDEELREKIRRVFSLPCPDEEVSSSESEDDTTTATTPPPAAGIKREERSTDNDLATQEPELKKIKQEPTQEEEDNKEDDPEDFPPRFIHIKKEPED